MKRRIRLGAVALLAALPLACVTGKSSKRAVPRETVRKPNVTDYASEGKIWFIGVDSRASRMTGPAEMLPVNLVLVNKHAGIMTLGRESFVLETPDGTSLPGVSYDQFKTEYRRDRQDLRIGEPYVERHRGRFHEPPFTWKELEFFPARNSGVVPRETNDMRTGDVVYGHVYFAAPSADFRFPEGKYRLLFRPHRSDVTYVVELFPF
jgi:hypothetical protein